MPRRHSGSNLFAASWSWAIGHRQLPCSPCLYRWSNPMTITRILPNETIDRPMDYEALTFERDLHGLNVVSMAPRRVLPRCQSESKLSSGVRRMLDAGPARAWIYRSFIQVAGSLVGCPPLAPVLRCVANRPRDLVGPCVQHHRHRVVLSTVAADKRGGGVPSSSNSLGS